LLVYRYQANVNRVILVIPFFSPDFNTFKPLIDPFFAVTLTEIGFHKSVNSQFRVFNFNCPIFSDSSLPSFFCFFRHILKHMICHINPYQQKYEKVEKMWCIIGENRKRQHEQIPFPGQYVQRFKVKQNYD
jgi:hypothetical protein